MEFPVALFTELLEDNNLDYSRVLRVAEVGSTAHGISNPNTGDDLDLTVVRYEAFSELVAGNPSRQSMMIRTQPEGKRSGPGDVDLQVYTLRKFATLAAAGNPSILAAIFSPVVHKASELVDFEELGRLVASKRAGSAFLGYMRQQIERWRGERGQKNVNRPELVEAYGFDTKYAAHVIRLGNQGIEYMVWGEFRMPMARELREEIISLRTGGISEKEALAWAEGLERSLKEAIERSTLPEKASPIEPWLVEQYRKFLTI